MVKKRAAHYLYDYEARNICFHEIYFKVSRSLDQFHTRETIKLRMYMLVRLHILLLLSLYYIVIRVRNDAKLLVDRVLKVVHDIQRNHC